MFKCNKHQERNIVVHLSSEMGEMSVRNTAGNPEGPQTPFDLAAILEQEGKVVTLINPKWVCVCVCV